MATLGGLKRQRREPNVQTIKKHSDIMRREGNTLVVGGARVKTQTGFIVPGFTGKTFETYYETMLAGTSTATLRHEKKDRTLRLLSGLLYILTQDDKGDHQRRVIAGDELVLERGLTYRLATSKENAEFFVCQSAKYSSTLEVIDDSSLTSREVSDELLEEPSLDHRISQTRPQDAIGRRRGSKAKQQQMAAAQAGRQSAQVVDQPIPGREGHPVSTAGVSPRPSGGKFNEEGAG